MLLVLKSSPGITAEEWWNTTNRSDWMLYVLKKAQIFLSAEQLATFRKLVAPAKEEFNQAIAVFEKEFATNTESALFQREALANVGHRLLIECADNEQEWAVNEHRRIVSEAWEVFNEVTKPQRLILKNSSAKCRAVYRRAVSAILRSILGNPFTEQGVQ